MLFVLSDLSVGGSETKIIRLANALAHAGGSVELAYLNPPETLLDRIDPLIPVTNLRRRGKYSVRSLMSLRDLVNREREVVIAVNSYPLLYAVPAAKWLSSSNIPIAGLVNTTISFGKERLLEKVYSPFLKQCDWIVFGCNAQKTLWVEKHDLPKEASQVIYNGVDHEFYSPASAAEEGALLRRQFEIPDSAIIFGSIGRLQPEKNFDHLIMALAKLNHTGRDICGLLVGQGEERDRLQKLAVEEGVADKIRFLGLQSDVRAALSTMDIFVLPSSSETFSNAALEAMAMARAVVLSEVGGAAEMIENGKSGMLFPAGNINALTKVLESLYDSREMQRALGSAARERVVTSFGFSEMVERYRALVRS